MTRLRDLAELGRLRLHRQRLVGSQARSAAGVVSWLGAVQAQEYEMAKWGIGQRVAAATDADIELAFSEGHILRTHAMRPTWHFIARDDLVWLQALTGHRVRRASASIHRRLGLDELTLGRATEVIVGALEGRHLTRSELAAHLSTAGFQLAGLALAYAAMNAELDGLICSGPRQGKRHTYALVSERAPNARRMDREEALAELARRYFSSHGPATLRDWAWWSGLTMADGRRGLASLGGLAEHIEVDGLTYHLVHRDGSPTAGRLDRPADPLIHLLPIYDEHLIAYRDRVASFDARVATRPLDQMPLLAQLMTSDGRFVGGWRRVISGEGLTVELQPLVALSADEKSSVASAAASYARFLGVASAAVSAPSLA